MEQGKGKTIVDRVWDLFASVKLAVVVFAVLSLTSIIGTIIEQNAEPQKNIKLLGKLFGESAAPALYRVFDGLGFMDMYHSWWFVMILILFAANLVICSIDRLPKIMKVVREPIKPLKDDQFKGFGIKKEIVLQGKPEKARDVVVDAIKRVVGFNLAEVKEDRGYQLFSQRGGYSRLGVYVTHVSILIILAGAIFGVFFGFKGFLNLPEGSVSNVAYARDGREMPLGFEIRCDDFEVDYYGNSDMPKEYKSWLTVMKDGREAAKQQIEVNTPLKFEGITFYQSSYGTVPRGTGNGVFRFKVTTKDGKSENVEAKWQGSFPIPGTPLIAKIEDFSPALGLDPTGRPFTYAEQMSNPAVFVGFYENSARKFGGWILKRYPDTWRLPDGNIMQFVDLWGVQYTGLQVRKDPGVWVVYLGCIVMAVGLFIAFFMSHRRLWVKLVEEKNTTRVMISASANKNRQAFERKIEKLVGVISQREEGGR